MTALIKMSLRLMFRNKGFLFFLLMTPALSALILSLKTEQKIFSEEGTAETVVELESCEENAVYSGNTTAFLVKVYDASCTELSDYVLKQLAGEGMFSICRADASALTEQEVEKLAAKDAFEDGAGVLLYLKKDFEQAVLENNMESALKLYRVSEDARMELFETELTTQLSQILQVQEMIETDASGIVGFLTELQEKMPQKEVIDLAGKDEVILNQRQIDQHTNMGYAFAVMTLGFIFCGTFVAGSVIEEKNNRVFTRIMLTKSGGMEYFLSKFVIAFLVSILQTGVLMVCLLCIPELDVGMSMASFMLLVFPQGLIFAAMSMVMGILIGDVMSANYAAFAVWSISALLAGLYFSLDDTTATMRVLSRLMPQKWFMDAGKYLLVGDKSVCSMLLYVTVAYLLMIISVGAVGIHSRNDG